MSFHLIPLMASGADVNIDIDFSFVLIAVLFSAFIMFLKPILLDPMLRVFEEREKQTEGARAQARKLDEKANLLLQQFEGEIEEVRRAAFVERDRLRAETAKLEADILIAAKESSAQIVEAGRVKIEREMALLRSELSEARPALAQQIASKILGREVSS